MRPAPTGIALALLALLYALLGAGCASKPESGATWSAPGGARGPFRNLIVFGVAAQGKVRSAYEDSFVAALRSRGAQARAGHDLLPAGGLGDVRSIPRASESSPADGVIITHLVGERTENARVAPHNFVTPSLYGSLYPYYQRVNSYVTEPGYYARYPVLQLETNLYDTARQKLVWSGRSASLSPDSEQTTIKAVIAEATLGMAKAGFLPR